MLHPQHFGALELHSLDGTVIGTCAIGAAAQAGYQFRVDLPETWVTCPATDGGWICKQRQNLHCLIVHLNDRHRWTREQIADWVATVEGDSHDGLDVQSVSEEAGDGISLVRAR